MANILAHLLLPISLLKQNWYSCSRQSMSRNHQPAGGLPVGVRSVLGPHYIHPSHQKRAMALSRIAANHSGST